jgi:exodeoxyribonuclease-3
MPLKIATWNVNSVKARLPHLLQFLTESAPDILMLQELKCVEAEFPSLDVTAAGYQHVVVGQKSYNGVAILSRHPIEATLRALPGAPDDEQARYLEANIAGLRVASIYLPNGNPVDSEKYPYKLAWMERLYDRARHLLAEEAPFVLAGDYNICPSDIDVYDPANWREDALCRPESRAAFRKIVNLGLTDALRALNPAPHLYTYWDYQAGRWSRDEGLRIDHLLLSPQTADRLLEAGVDKTPRGWQRASDHTPVWCTIAE